MLASCPLVPWYVYERMIYIDQVPVRLFTSERDSEDRNVPVLLLLASAS
jgi:hypothetical protein